ncbi:uncharacterized protein LOC132614763 [Lycium barbarum]|uniref:uncharacterized protein LOC132614763 n=1 Tax=Lycium barbarum TaxID=112863 RepID=UPI00293E612F|nr:uncharacterized protein LOC132614763 [Lycium barbarum]
MAQSTQPKRPREDETHKAEEDIIKRQKQYNELILSILEDEQDDPNYQDYFSDDIFSTLEQELSSPSSSCDSWPYPLATHDEVEPDVAASDSVTSKEEEEDDGNNFIRHLQEASDDELGITLPSTDEVKGDNIVDELNGTNCGDLPFALSDGLWEFEDHEAANYYSLLNSEFFM